MYPVSIKNVTKGLCEIGILRAALFLEVAEHEFFGKIEATAKSRGLGFWSPVLKQRKRALFLCPCQSQK